MLAENVIWLREQRGWSQTELGVAVGRLCDDGKPINQTTIQKLEAGGVKMPRYLKELANLFGVTTDDLLQKRLSQQKNSNVKQLGSIEVWSSQQPPSSSEFVFVPFFKDVLMQGGVGNFVLDDYNGFKIAFSRATLSRYNIDENNVFACTLDGDSMEPVLPEGTTISIDKGDNTIKDGRIYAFQHGDLLRVKRLYRLPNHKVRINSYNPDPAYADEIVELDEIVVIGRVFNWSVMS